MCNPVALILALAAAQGPPAAAAADTAALARRADSLAALWRDAAAFAGIRSAVRRLKAAHDLPIVQIGPLAIETDRASARVLAAARALGPLYDSTYGDAAPRLRDHPVTLRLLDPDDSIGRSRIRRGLAVSTRAGEPELEATLFTLVPALPVDSALAAWNGGPVAPALHPGRDLAAAYVDLVTADRASAHACFGGTRPACSAALGLAPDAGAWPDTPAQRRALVLHMFTPAFIPDARRGLYDACARRGDDSACTEMLRETPASLIPAPLSFTTRRTLVGVALRSGGRGAYLRLLAHPGRPIAERLAEAAGMPADSLIGRWRATVLQARRLAAPGPGAGGWASFVWIAVLGGLATRSSRWRLG